MNQVTLRSRSLSKTGNCRLLGSRNGSLAAAEAVAAVHKLARQARPILPMSRNKNVLRGGSWRLVILRAACLSRGSLKNIHGACCLKACSAHVCVRATTHPHSIQALLLRKGFSARLWYGYTKNTQEKYC